jgi:hypothetical protein
MTEADLFDVVRSAHVQTILLYSQFISISLATVAGIFLFLNRAGTGLKLIAYAVYLIGSLMFVGLMLEESNIKRVALNALADIPRETLSAMSAGLIDLQASWLFTTTAILLNVGLWALILAVTWLMFVWRKPDSAPAAPSTKGLSINNSVSYVCFVQDVSRAA